uniref:Innexin n=1 Tax=Panagrolaimus sp. PS1159 TaxID=55785 RepID=A0AC35F015_9BILA
MNMINEKIFLFFYFWLCFVATVTFINLCYHFAIFFIPFYQTQYVFLNSSKKNKNLEFNEFSQQFLKSDGILLVKFIRQNAGGRITSEIINDVFEKYLALPKLEKELLSPSKPEITYKSNGELLPKPEIVYFEETPKRKFLQDLPLLSDSAYV